MKTVRAALWPLLESAQAEVSVDMQNRLRSELAPLGKAQAAYLLQNWRAVALELAQLGTVRQRRKQVEQLPLDRQHLALYAMAAWVMRTLVLAEHLERAELQTVPKKWAAGRALQLLAEVEGQDRWLWPFDSDAPWDGDDNDYEDDDDIE